VAQRAGVAITEVRSVGGGNRSALWNQIKADVVGIPVALPQTSVGAPFGDAILVGLGLGLYPDIQATLSNMIKIKTRFEQNPRNHARYTEMYGVFRSTYEHLRDDFDHLASVFNQD
jgi:xylulokinase